MPNLFIKIPGTAEGLPAIAVNVTLLFSRKQYLAAAGAYLRGVERRIEAGREPGGGPSPMDRLFGLAADPADRRRGERMLGATLQYPGDQANARRLLEGAISRHVAPARLTPAVPFQYGRPNANLAPSRIVSLQGSPIRSWPSPSATSKVGRLASTGSVLRRAPTHEARRSG